MIEELKVFLSDLDSGLCSKLDVSVSPEFLNVKDADLAFVDPVHVQGDVYLAGDELIAKISCHTHASMTCKVCNEMTKVEVAVEGLYFTYPRSEVVNGQFNCTELVREAILLDLPAFAECGGDCPQRDSLGAYLADTSDSTEEEVYRPFADLQIEAVE